MDVFLYENLIFSSGKIMFFDGGKIIFKCIGKFTFIFLSHTQDYLHLFIMNKEDEFVYIVLNVLCWLGIIGMVYFIIFLLFKYKFIF